MAKHILDLVTYDTHAEIPTTATAGQLVFCKEHWALHHWGTAALSEPSNMGGQGGSPLDAWPVGSVFVAVVSTSPATLLGGGTWAAFGTGRVLVGLDAGDPDFDTAEEVGGAKTVTLTEAQMPSHTHLQNAHSHVENSNNATTGGLRGWGAPDTSTNTSTATGYSTADATAVNQNAGGGGAHSNVQPYIVVYMWKRTA